jgi:hypothetical protein
MTIVKTEIPAEKRELNDELTPDELEAVSGGMIAELINWAVIQTYGDGGCRFGPDGVCP